MNSKGRQAAGRGIRWRTATTGAQGRKGVVRSALALAVGATGVVAFGTTGPVAAGGATIVDTGSMSAITQITGAQAMWKQGFVGQGIGVAVIDTGVARVPGLDGAGKVIDGPDLSFDSQDPLLSHTDAFGHGTHIAGIIAGSDVAPGTSGKDCKTCVVGGVAYTDRTKFVGIAPESKIINVKVGAYDGAVDVTQVIAAIDWVVQHRNDPGLNIRVLNLSFGTDSLQPAQIDPLVFAAEAAWNAGIVVVAAGGNDGDAPGPLADPAMSPSVIAVGSTNPMGTLDTRDDLVADFAQHGTTERPIDVVAPGVSVTSLAVPGSFIDQNVTTGKIGTRFQRASGTSQSTAVVSGLAALMLSKYPTASPDAVKAYLKFVTTTIDTKDKRQDPYRGAGAANVSLVASTPTKDALGFIGSVKPVPTTGVGGGSIELSRGTYHVVIGEQPLAGELDIFGLPVDTVQLAQASAHGNGWNGGEWHGARWSADGWNGARWSSTDWTGNDWTGARWSGARWTDAVWDGARWSGARWTGARWSAGGWEGARWSGARWSGSSYS